MLAEQDPVAARGIGGQDAVPGLVVPGRGRVMTQPDHARAVGAGELEDHRTAAVIDQPDQPGVPSRHQRRLQAAEVVGQVLWVEVERLDLDMQRHGRPQPGQEQRDERPAGEDRGDRAAGVGPRAVALAPGPGRRRCGSTKPRPQTRPGPASRVGARFPRPSPSWRRYCRQIVCYGCQGLIVDVGRPEGRHAYEPLPRDRGEGLGRQRAAFTGPTPISSQ